MDKTLLKGLQVLTHVARADSNVRINEVAAALNLTKSNAYRMLKSLESAGFVSQDKVTKSFGPGLILWELGVQAMNRLDLRARAAVALRDLAAASRETVHLAVLDGGEVIYVEKIDSPEPVGAYTRLGARAPAYCVATGKALLSQLAEGELAPLLENLQPHSRFTITDPQALRAELAAAAVADFAINRGEWRDSVWGLASVVRDPTGGAVAAVGVSGPRYRLDDAGRIDELAELVRASARRITAALTFGVTSPD